MNVKSGKIYFCGYIMYPGVDVNEYWDFIRKEMMLVEVKKGLEMGVFPPGLVLKDAFGQVGIVDRDRRTVKRLNW